MSAAPIPASTRALLDCTVSGTIPGAPEHRHLVGLLPPGIGELGAKLVVSTILLLPRRNAWPNPRTLGIASSALRCGEPVIVCFADRGDALVFAQLAGAAAGCA